jgi:hypothetical protein
VSNVNAESVELLDTSAVVAGSGGNILIWWFLIQLASLVS